MCGAVVLHFISNPDAKEFTPKAKEEHRHTGERYGYTLGRGEAGHLVGKRTPRQRERECRGLGGLGRLNPTIGNQGMRRARKRRAYIAIAGKIRETEGSDHASAGKECSTRGPSEAEEGTCGGSDLQMCAP